MPYSKQMASISDGKGGIRFDHSPDELEKLVDDFLAHSQKVLDDIVNMPESKTHTFENTAKPFSQMEADSAAFSSVLTFY